MSAVRGVTASLVWARGGCSSAEGDRQSRSCAGVAVDPVGREQNGSTTLLGHGMVVLSPVIVLAARTGENLTQQLSDPGRVEPVDGVVGAGQRDRPFGRDPSVAGRIAHERHPVRTVVL